MIGSLRAGRDAAAGWVGGGPAAANAPGDEGAGAYSVAVRLGVRNETREPAFSAFLSKQRQQISRQAAEGGPGDFIYIPPYVPHQEINASRNETLECVLVRSDNEAVVVNLDIEPVEKPETVPWIDPIHKHG